MSRIDNFARGVFAGSLQMAANIIFTLASVPLALRYLSKEEFATWTLITQVAGYIALIDFGMSVSVSRILADQKDDRDGGRYGGILKAGGLVFCLQGLIIGLVAWMAAPSLASAFGNGPGWRGDFIVLLRGYGLVMAFSCAMKIWAAPFWGFQRYDIGNYSAVAGFALQFGLLWIGFSRGLGVRSFLIACVGQNLLTSCWIAAVGWRLGFYPRKGAWGAIEAGTLRELFTFGRDIFLMALGGQLLSASQVMIVARLMGLEAAATWVVCSKIFTLAQQLVSKILESSAGGFTEMFVRGESERLKLRFRDVTLLTASLSVTAAIVGASLNASFVAVWTHGRMAWGLPNDLLMGVLLAITAISRCFAGIAGITKEVHLLRFIYFFEGITFVVLAWSWGSSYGFVGMVAASITATIAWSGLYGFVRARRQWNCRTSELLGWLWPGGLQAVYLLPLALLCAFLFGSLSPSWRFLSTASSLGAVSSIVLWNVGIPKSLREEMIAKVRGRTTPGEAL